MIFFSIYNLQGMKSDPTQKKNNVEFSETELLLFFIFKILYMENIY